MAWRLVGGYSTLKVDKGIPLVEMEVPGGDLRFGVCSPRLRSVPGVARSCSHLSGELWAGHWVGGLWSYGWSQVALMDTWSGAPLLGEGMVGSDCQNPNVPLPNGGTRANSPTNLDRAGFQEAPHAGMQITGTTEGSEGAVQGMD